MRQKAAIYKIEQLSQCNEINGGIMKLEITYLPTNQLTPYKNNAKLHPQEQIDQIKNSIREFGMNDPIAVCGEDNIIVEGHGRLIACQQMGMDTVPVIRLDHLTEEERKAYTLAHNKLTMNTDFDLEILEQELKEINLNMADYGFDSIDESDVEIEEDGFDFDEEEEMQQEAKSKLGEIYQLGNHRLMCGDSTSSNDVIALMDSQEADLVITDPPYNVNISNSQGMTIHNDNMGDEDFTEFLTKAFQNMEMALKAGGAFYVWYAAMNHTNFEKALKTSGLKPRQQLVWVKNSLSLGRADYQWIHEPCLYGWKDGEGHYFTYDRTQCTAIESKAINFDELDKQQAIKMLKEIYESETTVIKEKKPSVDKLHPTMKPVTMMGKLIRNSSKKGEMILGLFGGSGSTLIACDELGRTCYTMEYDPHYVDVIIERWETLTGQKAKKVN